MTTSGRTIAPNCFVRTLRRLQIIVLAAAIVLPLTAASKKQTRVSKKGSASRVKTERERAPVFDPAIVNDAGHTPAIGPESSGPAVLRAQILLDRLHFSPGEIDGRYGRNTDIAIRGFQASKGLEPTGLIDAQLWQQLNTDNSPVLIPYTVAYTDVAGPFVEIPADMMEQAQLKALGYKTAAEALGEKFHIDPALLAKLNRGKDLSRAGEELLVPNVVREPAAAPKADRVIVSKTRMIVEARAGDKLLAQYPATIGSEHDPLPIGDWTITIVQKNPVFHYNPELFWDADTKHSKATIPAGPNNPVGLVWIGISKEHYGIHGTPEPGAVGHAQSHGCIRVTNWDAIELAAMVQRGLPVILQEP